MSAPVVRDEDPRARRTRSRLQEALLAECGIVSADRRLTAIAITALVDGLWLELCLSPDSFTADEARSLAERQLGSVLSCREDRGD